MIVFPSFPIRSKMWFRDKEEQKKEKDGREIDRRGNRKKVEMEKKERKS